ncbi:MAG: TAXI family TRAP transporter solute-binding subunit [Gammaproteobacteria bacterium]|nr:TAXI family TRAP transporter solute-binding subunit [Gammaproteobacteria bacterium]MCP5424451.1 TAXI family TRAP transporter solute-binding subunit [Gammaproteobacteria bacterium]MCP5458445.1 TAXI family TRAP transporter solute-binding subunit [Gammaproteobacteria bacterium]
MLMLLVHPCLATEEAPAAEPSTITIGTGSEIGVYYPLGKAICGLVNRERDQVGIRCLAINTEGSVYNLNALRAGELDMALVQSDWQYHDFYGTNLFKNKGPDKRLRAVFAAHKESFTVVVGHNSGIKSFDDLKGKRVNVGNPGSGQRATLEVVMEVKGWTMNDFAATTELPAVEQAQSLCDGQADAIIFIVGHPNQSILEATAACDSVIVPLDSATIAKLVDTRPYYSHAVVRGGLYRGNPEDVETFGVTATLVTTERTPEATVYEAVKAVFENFEEFRTLHPSLVGLDKKAMTQDGLSAPLHPGAMRYYEEAGLLQPPKPAQ